MLLAMTQFGLAFVKYFSNVFGETKMECCPPKYRMRLKACRVFTMSSVRNLVISDSCGGGDGGLGGREGVTAARWRRASPATHRADGTGHGNARERDWMVLDGARAAPGAGVRGWIAPQIWRWIPYACAESREVHTPSKSGN